MYKHVMYRAKILKKIDEIPFYHIFFIDFGNEVDVHIDDIYELPDELKKVNTSIFLIHLLINRAVN